MVRKSSSPDWGGNYPPGAKNDPRAPYNRPDRSHEHEWQPDGGNPNPVIEDGAAIFHERCQYVEGRRGEGWQCEEVRRYRFEYHSLEQPGGDRYELPTIENWDEVSDPVAEAVISVEEAVHGDRDGVSWDVDPDPEVGHVEIEWNGYTLRFEP